MFELKCSAAGGRLEPDPTAARRAAGERVTSASRVVVIRSDSATLAAMTRWHGPGPVTTRVTADSARRAAGRRVKARPLRPGQQGRVSLNLECRLARPCGSPGRHLGRQGAVARGPGVGAGHLQARRAALWRDRLRRRVAESDPARGTGPGHPGCWVTVTPARARLAPSHGDH